MNVAQRTALLDPRKKRLQTIRGILPSVPPGITEFEVLHHWTGPLPNIRTIRRDLKRGRERGMWTASGRGVPYQPQRYWVRA